MFIEHLKPFIDWLHIHPHWAGFFVFLISFGESIAVFGLLVPGSVVMTAIGALMGAGVLPIYPMMSWGIAGAIIGDIFSFWLGHHFHQDVRKLWPFTHYPQILAKGEIFFQNHGGKSVFLGRFVGPIRPVIPLIAGMLNMRAIRFLIADIPAAIAWAPAYMLPGILLGELSLQLQPEIATQFLLSVFAILMSIWLIYWLLKQMFLSILDAIRSAINHWWQHIASHRWATFMRVKDDLTNPRQFRLFIWFCCLLIAFVVLAYNVMQQNIFTDLNNSAFHFMRSLRNPTADYVMNLITFLAAKQVIIGLVFAMAVYFAVCKRYWALLHLLILAILSWFSIGIIKDWTHSPRPGVLLFAQNDWSFPSGHTSLALIGTGFLAALIAENAPSLVKRCWYTIVACIAAAVALSRLYLGVHWLSDILGAILLGLALLTGILFSYRQRNNLPFERKFFCVIWLLSWFLLWGAYSYTHIQSAIRITTPYWPIQILDEKNWWVQSGNAPPLYRANRFGKPVQLINIQWAGDLKKIQRALQQKDWKIPAKPDLAVIVNRFTHTNTSNLNPISLTQYYSDSKPSLVITKLVGERCCLIVLRLWNSHTLLRKSGYPIWVGTASYYRPWEIGFLKKSPQQQNHQATIPAIDELKKDLGAFRWKQIVYARNPLKTSENVDWTGYALLIKA
jgi:membrane protein DedA with SNARE-associated domain/membrane-associated phospholipid phosphatase